MEATDDDKIALGMFCEHMLSAPEFAAVTNLYETSTVQQLLTTKPQDRGKRDELFFSIRGVRDLLSLMTDLVKEKNRLLGLDTTPKPSEDDEAFDIYDTPHNESDDV